jgi:hypothetical protein
MVQTFRLASPFEDEGAGKGICAKYQSEEKLYHISAAVFGRLGNPAG